MTDTPCAADFHSHAALNKPVPDGMDPCKWASCSLFPSLEVIKKKMQAFKSLREYKFAAQLQIDAGCGKIVETAQHIDFWRYSDFNPLEAIIDVKAIGDE